ncbi:hypothetical protein EDB86DRAFT_514518 [Lactarius hatsudake]|nr:hypothetical protein EDB86DRAFT_514518 [Lactarius hatsudake]
MSALCITMSLSRCSSSCTAAGGTGVPTVTLMRAPGCGRYFHGARRPSGSSLSGACVLDIFSPTITMQEISLQHVPVPFPPGAISYLKRARQ